MNTLKNNQNQIGKPLVCVMSITYNHAPYIADTMNGFCMQKTSFPFVCAVIDDCSTDGEQEVISNYLHEHFDLEDQSVARYEETDDYKLVYARHKENHNCFFVVLYLNYNHYSIGKDSRKYDYIKEFEKNAKYIAICEGDDYWTDPLKLQKQVDYMENHPECGLIWAKARKFYQEAGVFKGTAGSNTENYYDMFIHYGVSPLTSMYRKSTVEGYSEFVKGQKWLLGDSPLFLYIAHDNDIHFMDEIVGVYRILKNSASHHISFEKNLAFQNSTFDVVKFYCEKYGHPNFKQLETIHYSRVFNYAFNYGKYDVARELYEQIPYPNLKIKFKRFILPSRILRYIYQFLYHKLVN